MVVVHVASASQITVVQRALGSLMVVSVFDTSLLHWASRVALAVSSPPWLHSSLFAVRVLCPTVCLSQSQGESWTVE